MIAVFIKLVKYIPIFFFVSISFIMWEGGKEGCLKCGYDTSLVFINMFLFFLKGCLFLVLAFYFVVVVGWFV